MLGHSVADVLEAAGRSLVEERITELLDLVSEHNEY